MANKSPIVGGSEWLPVPTSSAAPLLSQQPPAQYQQQQQQQSHHQQSQSQQPRRSNATHTASTIHAQARPAPFRTASRVASNGNGVSGNGIASAVVLPALLATNPTALLAQVQAAQQDQQPSTRLQAPQTQTMTSSQASTGTSSIQTLGGLPISLVLLLVLFAIGVGMAVGWTLKPTHKRVFTAPTTAGFTDSNGNSPSPAVIRAAFEAAAVQHPRLRSVFPGLAEPASASTSAPAPAPPAPPTAPASISAPTPPAPPPAAVAAVAAAVPAPLTPEQLQQQQQQQLQQLQQQQQQQQQQREQQKQREEQMRAFVLGFVKSKENRHVRDISSEPEAFSYIQPSGPGTGAGPTGPTGAGPTGPTGAGPTGSATASEGSPRVLLLYQVLCPHCRNVMDAFNAAAEAAAQLSPPIAFARLELNIAVAQTILQRFGCVKGVPFFVGARADGVYVATNEVNRTPEGILAWAKQTTGWVEHPSLGTATASASANASASATTTPAP